MMPTGAIDQLTLTEEGFFMKDTMHFGRIKLMTNACLGNCD